MKSVNISQSLLYLDSVSFFFLYRRDIIGKIDGMFFFNGYGKKIEDMREKEIVQRKVYRNAVTASRCDIYENVATSVRASAWNDFGDT